MEFKQRPIINGTTSNLQTFSKQRPQYPHHSALNPLFPMAAPPPPPLNPDLSGVIRPQSSCNGYGNSASGNGYWPDLAATLGTFHF